jgi:hypothetical protein
MANTKDMYSPVIPMLLSAAPSSPDCTRSSTTTSGGPCTYGAHPASGASASAAAPAEAVRREAGLRGGLPAPPLPRAPPAPAPRRPPGSAFPTRGPHSKRHHTSPPLPPTLPPPPPLLPWSRRPRPPPRARGGDGGGGSGPGGGGGGGSRGARSTLTVQPTLRSTASSKAMSGFPTAPPACRCPGGDRRRAAARARRAEALAPPLPPPCAPVASREVRTRQASPLRRQISE